MLTQKHPHLWLLLLLFLGMHQKFVICKMEVLICASLILSNLVKNQVRMFRKSCICPQKPRCVVTNGTVTLSQTGIVYKALSLVCISFAPSTT